jgi:hypothetical protein
MCIQKCNSKIYHSSKLSSKATNPKELFYMCAGLQGRELELLGGGCLEAEGRKVGPRGFRTV